MKGFLCAGLFSAVIFAAPVLAVSLDQQDLPAPAWQLEEVKAPETRLQKQKPQLAEDRHTETVLQRQMRQLEKLRQQAERDAARAKKLQQLKDNS
ncbi:hypothetical protein [Microbulbifer magnicolonia]|uniref:hypothetical protein n=1 Tax=Microbulbifer magnicolonia TaxID=3109744 RepID=UPI002B40A5DD|nr:hypothetical protein [Microbulbifer sp. GG15]